MHKFLEVPPIYHLLFVTGFLLKQLKNRSNNRLFKSENSKLVRMMMMMKNSCNYPTLPCLVLGTYSSSIMTQVVVITGVGWLLELKKLAPTDWRLSFRFLMYITIILPPPSTKLPGKKKPPSFKMGFP
jgi:hypothetical protein